MNTSARSCVLLGTESSFLSWFRHFQCAFLTCITHHNNCTLLLMATSWFCWQKERPFRPMYCAASSAWLLPPWKEVHKRTCWLLPLRKEVHKRTCRLHWATALVLFPMARWLHSIDVLLKFEVGFQIHLVQLFAFRNCVVTVTTAEPWGFLWQTCWTLVG